MTLSLTNWAKIIGYNPFLLYGFNMSAYGQIESPCSRPVAKYNWQDADDAGREEIQNAIANAEAILSRYLGYNVTPVYAEQQLTAQPLTMWGKWTWGWLGGWGYPAYPAMQLDKGFVQSLGVEALTLIAADVTVAYSDSDGDGLKDTFTLGPIATTETDPLIFRVYNSAADRYDGSGVGEQWNINPIRVTISAGLLTITGPSWVCGIPKFYERATWDVNGIAPVEANWVTTLDIYTSQPNTNGTTNATAEGLLIWENGPWSWCCGPQPVQPNADPAQLRYGFARGNIRTSRNGWVYEIQSVYNATTQTWSASWFLTCSPPSGIVVRYLSGLDVERNVYSPWYGQMQREYQIVVARLAAAQLTRPPLGCEAAWTRELARWQRDSSLARGNNNEIYNVTREQLNNPIGPRMGEIQAWEFITNQMKATGITIS